MNIRAHLTKVQRGKWVVHQMQQRPFAKHLRAKPCPKHRQPDLFSQRDVSAV